MWQSGVQPLWMHLVLAGRFTNREASARRRESLGTLSTFVPWSTYISLQDLTVSS